MRLKDEARALRARVAGQALPQLVLVVDVVVQHVLRHLVLRQRVGKGRLSDLDQGVWRELMGDMTVRTSRTIGWLLLVGGILAAVGLGVYEIVFNSSVSLFEKFIVAAIYLGMAGLFFSVLRQRLIERKTDKYKDVEI